MNKKIREILKSNFNVVSFRNGVYTVKKSYYWGITKSGEEHAKKVLDLIPGAKILDYGNHFRPFHGGAKPGSEKDSYFYVKFTLGAEDAV